MPEGRWKSVLGLSAAVLAATPAMLIADEVDELRREVRQLRGEVAELRRPEPAPAAPLSAAGPPSIKIDGYIQADGRWFEESDQGDNEFFIRRARLNIGGKLTDDLSFRLAAEFGDGADGELYDAYLDWAAVPGGYLRIGKYTVPLGLERNQSGKRLLFIERALTDNLIPNRDVGIGWFADQPRLEAALAVMNEAADRQLVGSDSDDGKALVGRLFFKPKPGLGFGIGGSIAEADENDSISTYKTSSRATVATYRTGVLRDGVEARLSPQFYWYSGPFGVLGEYVVSRLEVARGADSEKISNSAWQLAVSWVVTGENNGWGGVAPRSPFQRGGSGWGAFELVARITALDLDSDLFPIYANPDTAVSKAEAWGLGLNWYANNHLKISLNAEQTRFDGGAANGVDRDDENLVLARAQLAF